LQWECDVCGKVFDEDEKDEAEECCKEVYVCLECGTEYDNEDDAVNCCEEDTEE